MKILSVEEFKTVLGALPDEPRIVASGNFATPTVLLEATEQAVERFCIFQLNPQVGLPDRDGITLETPFVGAGMRRSPRLRYLPARLSLVPLLFRSTCRLNVLMLHTSTPHQGTVSMGTEVNVLPAAVEAVRASGGMVIAQANRKMPYTFGDGVLPVDSLDYMVEVDLPLPAIQVPRELDEVSRTIGERVAALVPDGATLQLGIGAVPDATLQGLAKRRGLRVWSEMFSDRVLVLDRAGALDPDAMITASFTFGSQELYDWLDHNPRVRMLRTEKTNDPALIASQPAMTSINSALQVDLFAQANASRINNRIYSGFGGQTDFIVGALHSDGGQAFIALASWHPKADCSTIVPLLDEPVTSFQHSAIVTEQGVAPIWGYDQKEQARNLIDHAAHPSVREEMWEEAGHLGLT